ncbi:MAG: phosphate ABC transporter substrate-binding protein [Rhizobiales bacterium PAR1]|nr:MAG: phosphate ABC transporter substrate-binding protein [Rhizobiales bacterium PAR1]
MRTLRLSLASIWMALLLLASGMPALAKEIAVVGTGDGLDILRSVAEAYGRENPGTTFAVPPSIGSGGAIVAIGSNREVLGRVARPLTSSEAASGIQYRPVFNVPSAFFVHPGIQVRDLSAKQLLGIFAGVIVNWKEVGGPDLRIRVVRREEADSSLLVFRTAIPEFRELKFTERSKLAVTTQDAIESIRENPGGIGFASYSAVLARELGAVAINGVKPADKGYPANVVLALIFKQDRIDNDIRRFIDYFRSATARGIVESFGATPLHP